MNHFAPASASINELLFALCKMKWKLVIYFEFRNSHILLFHYEDPINLHTFSWQWKLWYFVNQQKINPLLCRHGLRFFKVDWKNGRVCKCRDDHCVAHLPLGSKAEDHKHILSVAHTCQEEKRKVMKVSKRHFQYRVSWKRLTNVITETILLKHNQV